MTPKSVVITDYKKIISERIKLKYPSLIIGVIVSYLLSLIVYNNLSNVKFITQRKNEKQNIIPKNEPKIYVVQEGDDLWKIAQKTLGSGYNAYDISAANNITDANSIFKGQKLIIPSVFPRESTNNVQENISAIMTSRVSFTGPKYTVKEGDFLWKIALEVYGDGNAWTKIADFNHISFPYEVEKGTTLEIPR